jgi:hypothetical protein
MKITLQGPGRQIFKKTCKVIKVYFLCRQQHSVLIFLVRQLFHIATPASSLLLLCSPLHLEERH